MRTEIKTERLTLRPYRESDAAVVARLLNDLHVSRWLTRVPHPYSEQDALNFFSLSRDEGDLVFAVCDTQGLVGCVSLHPELGYWFGQACWGRGYATEAARALVAHHFNRSDQTLPSGYHLGNAGSMNVLQKLGFKPTQTRTAFALSQQTDVTIQGMELTKDRWEALQ